MSLSLSTPVGSRLVDGGSHQSQRGDELVDWPVAWPIGPLAVLAGWEKLESTSIPRTN